MYVRGLRCETRLSKAAGYRLRQILWRRTSQSQVNIGKVLAIKRIEFWIVIRVMLRPVPPVPVAAFRDQQLFKGKLLLLRRGPLSVFGEEIPRCGKPVPRCIIFRRADPDIEIGVDP